MNRSQIAIFVLLAWAAVCTCSAQAMCAPVIARDARVNTFHNSSVRMTIVAVLQSFEGKLLEGMSNLSTEIQAMSYKCSDFYRQRETHMRELERAAQDNQTLHEKLEKENTDLKQKFEELQKRVPEISQCKERADLYAEIQVIAPRMLEQGQFKEQVKQLTEDKTSLEAGAVLLKEQVKQLTENKTSLEAGAVLLKEQVKQLTENKTSLEAGAVHLEAQVKQLTENKTSLEAGAVLLKEQVKQLTQKLNEQLTQKVEVNECKVPSGHVPDNKQSFTDAFICCLSCVLLLVYIFMHPNFYTEKVNRYWLDGSVMDRLQYRNLIRNLFEQFRVCVQNSKHNRIQKGDEVAVAQESKDQLRMLYRILHKSFALMLEQLNQLKKNIQAGDVANIHEWTINHQNTWKPQDSLEKLNEWVTLKLAQQPMNLWFLRTLDWTWAETTIIRMQRNVKRAQYFRKLQGEGRRIVEQYLAARLARTTADGQQPPEVQPPSEVPEVQPHCGVLSWRSVIVFASVVVAACAGAFVFIESISVFIESISVPQFAYGGNVTQYVQACDVFACAGVAACDGAFVFIGISVPQGAYGGNVPTQYFQVCDEAFLLFVALSCMWRMVCFVCAKFAAQPPVSEQCESCLQLLRVCLQESSDVTDGEYYSATDGEVCSVQESSDDDVFEDVCSVQESPDDDVFEEVEAESLRPPTLPQGDNFSEQESSDDDGIEKELPRPPKPPQGAAGRRQLKGRLQLKGGLRKRK